MKKYWNQLQGYLQTIGEPQISMKMVLILTAAMLFYSIVGLLMGSPIFASDEYAFLIYGKFIRSISDLQVLDPHLQKVSNVAYFSIVHFWVKLGFEDPTYVIRFIHVIEYGVTACFVYGAFAKIADRRSLVLGMVGMLLLPHACYSLSIMPEIEMVLAGAILGFIVIVKYPKQPDFSAFLMGGIVGIALLIKPHAMALLGAAILTIGLAYYLGIISRSSKFAVTRQTLILLITTYVMAVVTWKVCTQQWVFNPLNFLGLGIYGKYLVQNEMAGGFLWKLTQTAVYTGAHVSVLLLLFSPALTGIAVGFMKMFSLSRPETHFEETSTKKNMALIFAVAMLAAHVLMASYYSAGAAAVSPFEAMRLHGRYLGPVLVFLPLFYFMFSGSKHESLRIPMGIVLLGAVLVNQLLVFPNFKIYPWDYPALYGFYTFPNHYRWSVDGITNLIGHGLVLGLLGGSLLVIFWKKKSRAIFEIMLFVVLAMGIYQNLNWMFLHTRANRDLSQKTRAFSMLLKENAIGRGVFISDERYGSMSYALYGLANAPKVLVREPNSRITEEDVRGADWVLLGQKYVVDFDHSGAIKTGPFVMYPINTGILVDAKGVDEKSRP